MAFITDTLRGRFVTNFKRLFEMDRQKEEIDSNTTLVADDHCGKALIVTASATLTLPASATGVIFDIYNGGNAAGEVEITITPNGTDDIGGDGNTSANVDVVNTLATAKPGDRIRLIGAGNGAWFVDHVVGTWEWGS